MKKKLSEKIDDFLKKSEKKKKEFSPPEKFFQDAGNLWISLYGELIAAVDGKKADPDFWNDGVQKRNMKSLLASLRRRSEEQKVEWTKEVCLGRLESFLRKAKEDKFVGDNFMLHIINGQKVKIFNNQITQKYVVPRQNKEGSISRRSNLESPAPTTKSKGGFGKLSKHQSNGG